MTEEKLNSLCKTCYWYDQCGGKEMTNCDNYDSLVDSEELEDLLIQDYIDNNRRTYEREWESYIEYCTYENWREDYDSQAEFLRPIYY